MSEPRYRQSMLSMLLTAGRISRYEYDAIKAEAASPTAVAVPDPNALATALYRDYDYTVTPDDIRAAYARLTAEQEERGKGGGGA